MKQNHFMWASMMPTAWVMRLATIFGAGYFKWGPGTVGSAIGILWYVTVFTSVGDIAYLVILAATLYFSAGICGEAAARMGKKDPGSVILDEFVVMPICYIGLDAWMDAGKAWLILPLGFILFRIFDITKPWLIGKLDQIEGGWGILLDDVGAAIATSIIMHLLFTLGLIRFFGVSLI